MSGDLCAVIVTTLGTFTVAGSELQLQQNGSLSVWRDEEAVQLHARVLVAWGHARAGEVPAALAVAGPTALLALLADRDLSE